jgi:hypothetical protein
MSREAEAVLTGIDLNATRACVVGGPAGAGQGLPLDGRHADLPLAVSLEHRHPDVGRAGVACCRRLPHLACVDFLADLGGPRVWGSGRQRLTADAALALVLDRLRSACGPSDAAVLALPAYLGPEQAALATELAGRARLPVVGVVTAPLAVALAGHADQAWSSVAVVLDVDAHALTLALVGAEEGQARLLDFRAVPQLGMRVWKQRLLDGIADHCVRQSRRDPRDSAGAEQALYDQLDAVLESSWQGRLAQVAVETPQWYQNLMLRPEDVAGPCASLLRQTVGLAGACRDAGGAHGEVRAILVTAAAARLPGLLPALEDRLDRPVAFGEDRGGDARRPAVRVLAAQAVAGAVHDLVGRVCRGDMPAGRIEVAPLPSPRPASAGAPRLHFRGRDYPLHGRSFVLGHHAGCDLVFDPEQHPEVAARHCEITRDRRGFVLHDRTPHGTSVNDRPVVGQLPLRPGDWIRLGPGGPVVRFLGQAAAQQPGLATPARRASEG